MGTRGFITFVAEGVEKTAYNHNDSYPDGLGVDVLRFLQANRHDLICKMHGSVTGSPADLIRQLRVIDPQSTPTAEDIEQLKPFTDLNVSSRSTDDWYCLLRHTQGSPSAMLQAGVIEDASEFPRDSLFAEYGYVIDLDAQTFEVYEGFQKEPHTKGRFHDREPLKGYHPVALAQSWPLAALPPESEFLAALEEDDES